MCCRDALIAHSSWATDVGLVSKNSVTRDVPIGLDVSTRQPFTFALVSCNSVIGALVARKTVPKCRALE